VKPRSGDCDGACAERSRPDRATDTLGGMQATYLVILIAVFVAIAALAAYLVRALFAAGNDS
jgi:hypothetical protein